MRMPSLRHGKIILMAGCVCCLCIFLAIPSVAQIPRSIGLIDSDLAPFSFTDDRGNALTLYAVSGLVDDNHAYSRTLGMNVPTGRGLRSYEARKEYYAHVLQEVVVQEEFIALDVLGAFASFPEESPWHDFLFQKILPEVPSFLLKTFQMLDDPVTEKLTGQVLVKLNYLKNTGPSRQILNALKAKGRWVRRGIQNGSFDKALGALSVVKGSLSLSQSGQELYTSYVLMKALQMDLALERLNFISNHSTLSDPAFRDALAETIHDFENFPADTWGQLFRAIALHPEIAREMVSSTADIGEGLLAMTGWTHPHPALSGGIGALLFTIETGFVIDEHLDALRTSALAATLYRSLYDGRSSPANLEVVEYSQLIFLRDLQTAIGNGYMLFLEMIWPSRVQINDSGWELIEFKRGDTRRYLRSREKQLLELVLERRIPAFSNPPSVTTPDLFYGFEDGLGDWQVTTERTATHAITTEFAHAGSHAFKAGPSTCSANCYGNDEQAVSLILDLQGAFVSEISFWALENSSFTSNFGQAGWIEINGNGEAVENSVFDPHTTDGKQVWVFYSVPINTPVDELKFYFRDLTNSGSLFVDDITIRTGGSSSDKTNGLKDASGTSPNPSSSLALALLLDSSGSMRENDPHRLRVEAAKLATDKLPNDASLALLDFDDKTLLLHPMAAVGENRLSLKGASDRLDADGGTNIGDAVQDAAQLLSETTATTRAAILLTDGKGNYEDQGSLFVQNGWRLYTIGLGAGINIRLLASLAQQSGALYFKATTAADLGPILDAILADLTGNALVATFTDHLNPREQKSYPFYLDDTATSLSGLLTWDSGSLQIQLRDPNGRRVHPQMARGKTYAVFQLPSPQPGLWEAVAEATTTPVPSFQLQLSSESPLRPEFRSFPTALRPGTVATFRLTLPLLNIDADNVSASLRYLSDNGTNEVIPLRAQAGPENVLFAGQLRADTALGDQRVSIEIKGKTRSGAPFQRFLERTFTVTNTADAGNPLLVTRIVGGYLEISGARLIGLQVGLPVRLLAPNGDILGTGYITSVIEDQATVEIQRLFVGSLEQQSFTVEPDSMAWRGDIH